MIRINLLPEYRRKSEFPTWKLYRIIAYVFLGLSILLWGYHLAMFKYTPYGCWLTSVKQGNKPDQMSIAGKAMKMDDIVKFISLLQARPDIANVQLISADESNNNNSSTAGVIDFTLEIQRSGVKK